MPGYDGDAYLEMFPRDTKKPEEKKAKIESAVEGFTPSNEPENLVDQTEDKEDVENGTDGCSDDSSVD